MKLFLVFTLFITSCSHSALTTPNNAVPAQGPKALNLIIPKDDWEPIFFEEINERAKIANLKSLRSAPLPENDLEVRVWNGFGLTALEGFVLNRTNGEWSAVHLEGIHPRSPPSEFQKKLPAPKSGWDECWRRLEVEGILTLPDASSIDCSAMVNDGMSYVVEFSSNGTYKTYLYDNPSYAKCNEAKQIIKIANIISEEFGVSEMGTKERE